MKTASLMLLVSAVLGGFLGLRGLADDPGPARAQRVTAETEIATGRCSATLGGVVQPASPAQWQREFQSRRNRDFSQVEHRCLLSSVRRLSGHFDERRPLSTDRDAAALLITDRSEADLLALWLNVASGAVALDDPAGDSGSTIGRVLAGRDRVASAPQRDGRRRAR